MTPHVTDIELRFGVRIRLRDGIHLAATAYLPKHQPTPAPCVLAMTPYTGDLCHDRGTYFAAHGIPFVIVDVRGRGNSEGQFRPNIQEAEDGYDVVEWLADQPFCNGKVGMWGGSYLGYAQWAAAKEVPPQLATIVPTAAPYMGLDFPLRSNIFFPYLLQWLHLIAGRALQSKAFADTAFWSSQFRRWYQSGRSFREIDSFLDEPSAVFQEWINHPQPDAYWDAYNPTREQYANIAMPILTITGTYDDDQLGALEHYRQHIEHAPHPARARHYLVIGPWNHSGTGRPGTEFGGLKVGAASVIDLPRLHREWYAWTMQDGPRPDFLQRNVAYYVTGAERWRYADTLAAATAQHHPYFLDSEANANDVFSAGLLSAGPGRRPPDWYVYDPRDLDGPEIRAEAHAAGDSLVDQSVVLALRGKCLVYHSTPFAVDTEVTGFFKLHAWLAIDCFDTDFYVSVYEIAADGSSLRLSVDAMRARYRTGLRTAQLIQTREPLRYDFERFTFVSRLIKRGHRIRLVIAPMGRLLDAPFAQKNYNGGGMVADESVEDARPVTVQLFHDESHPTVLYVPLGREDPVA
jgi:putative CocE/NonD family hydrolase